MPLTTAAASTAAPLVFRFGWDRTEFLRFYRALVRCRTRTFKNSFPLWLPYPFVAIGVCAGAAILATSDTAPFTKALPWLLFALIWAALARLPARSAARRYPANNPYFDPLDMRRVVDADGVECGTANAVSRLGWAAMHKVVETEEFFLFYTSPACAIYLPQRAIPDEASRAAVQSMVRAHMPEGACALR